MELAYIVYTALFAVTMLFAYLGINANRGRARDNVVITPKAWFYWGIAILFYTLILGLRENVGIDYTSYKNIYQDLIRWGKTDRGDTDLIYYIFLPVVKNLHYNFFIAFLAFVPIFFLFRSFENKTRILLLYLFFYFTTVSFFSSLNLMRQYSAMFIIFFAINQFLKKDYKQFIIYYILAFIIHRSCIVFLPFIFLFKYDFLKWRWLQYALLFGSLIVGNILFENLSLILSIIKLPDFMNSYQEGYLESLSERTERMEEIMASLNFRIGPIYYLNLFLNCTVIFFSIKLKERYKHYNFTLFYNFFIIGLILTNILGENEGLDRILLYFRFYNPFIYAVLFSYLFNSKGRSKVIMKGLCIIIMIIYILIFYKDIGASEYLKIAPYQFI